MAQTSTYKQLSHLPRYITQESALNGGIIYTDNAIDEGYFNMVANMEYDDIKACLASRKGLQAVAGSEALLLDDSEDAPVYYVLGEFPTVVWTLEKNNTSTDAVVYYTRKKDTYTSCILCAPLTSTGDGYDSSHLRVLVNVNNTYHTTKAKALTDSAFGFEVTAAVLDSHIIKKQAGKANTPVATFFQNTLYVLGKDTTTNKTELDRLQIFHTPEDGYCFSFKADNTPYDVSASEAVSSGYNMLKGEQAYSFSNRAGAVWNIEGIIPTDDDGNILLGANVGKLVHFNLVYEHPEAARDTQFCFKWEWAASDTASSETQWASMVSADANTSVITKNAGEVISVSFKPTVPNFIVRVTIYPQDNEDDVKAVGTTSLTKVIDNKTRAELNTYDLSSAGGMTAWQGRLVLWGVENADNILFASDINNASYFPYPNNVHIFDKPIVQVINYMDGLLVFTTERIYLLDLSTDGTSFSVTAVQNRLSFNKEDAQYIQAIKNMVFFKTDNYFYMIVPKATSLTGELTVAPIYKAMAAFFNDTKTAIEKHIVKEIYAKPLIEQGLYNHDAIESDGLVSNYVDQNTIRTLYQARVKMADETRYVTVVLNYDTTTRVWSFHTYETNGRPVVAQYQLSTSEAPLLNTYRKAGKEFLQILKYTGGVCEDNFALNEDTPRLFKNILFIDTGYHDMASYADFKKRFREIQFKVFAAADSVLEFGTAFFLDGTPRKDYKFYNTTPENGTLYLGKMDISSDAFVYNGGTWACTLLDDCTIPYETTVTEVLGNNPQGATSDCTRLGAWRISLSTMRAPTAITFRQPVSGKGLLPRFKLLGFREMPIELNGINWVYHLMNGR